jgi:hypothetical protein
VVGGFTLRRRAQVYAQLRRAAAAPGTEQVRALVQAVPTDPVELFDPLRLVNRRRLTHWLRRRLQARRMARFRPLVTALVLVGQVAYALGEFGPDLIVG